MQQFHFRIVARIKWGKHILITFASLMMNEEADAETKLVSDHLGVALTQADAAARTPSVDSNGCSPSRRFSNVHINYVVHLKRSLWSFSSFLRNVNNWISVHKILQLVSFRKLPLTRGGRSANFINIFSQ